MLALSAYTFFKCTYFQNSMHTTQTCMHVRARTHACTHAHTHTHTHTHIKAMGLKKRVLRREIYSNIPLKVKDYETENKTHLNIDSTEYEQGENGGSMDFNFLLLLSPMADEN